MRVIAGLARRIPLVAPASTKGLSTRPTSDRAKESLFNMLSARLDGTRFLDLFCGSGAMGIEALSRGAKEAVFVDSSRSAIAATDENLKKTKLIDPKTRKIEIMGVHVLQAIKQLSQSGRCFDIIFLDPPYDLNNTSHLKQTLDELSTAGILSDDGLLVAETDAKVAERAPDLIAPIPPFKHIDTRNYGRTCFLFYNMRGGSE